MEEKVISFELAKTLHERGFDFYFLSRKNYVIFEHDYIISNGDEDILLYEKDKIHQHNKHENYSVNYPKISYDAPTQSQLQKWMRDVHKIVLEVKIATTDPTYKCKIWFKPQPGKNCSNQVTEVFKTYEEALEEGLKIGLTLISD